jgi:hypothetical protein
LVLGMAWQYSLGQKSIRSPSRVTSLAHHYQGVVTMTRNHPFARVTLASLLAIAYSSAPLFAQGEAKWFVLRNHEVGNCWTATLVRIDGQYTSTFEQKAGGPFDTEAQAVERQKALENEGACNRD